MACLYAYSNLRSSGGGSAIADELTHFTQQQNKKRELMEYALSQSKKVDEYYQLYIDAYDKGLFK